MEKDNAIINSSVLLRVVLKDPYKVELVDGLSITTDIKIKAVNPYLDYLFDSLVHHEESCSPRISRYAFNEVIIFI